ncbi:protein Mis18-beta [Cyprinodon tularosa]|uniref:protein Mis18-beta n=1 Tax=Cyprinodon tularosa TaxID=77115 RepID=UPI0018E20D2A|nr:protein Mis18-beta [Cyprinodon tularosa]
MEFDESFIVERFDDLSISGAAEQGQLMTFHCLQCNTILADSLTVCGEIKSIDSIMCIRVTNDVVVSEALESVNKGVMTNCIYSHLKCRSCNYVVGRVIHAAPLHLTAIRSIFLLNKAMMSSYILDSSSMVKTSSLSFDLKPLQETVIEVREEFEEELNQLADSCSRLTDSSMSSQSTVHS